jgi:hypothetical protein
MPISDTQRTALKPGAAGVALATDFLAAPGTL